MQLSKGLACEKYGIVGTDFWELFHQRDLIDDDIMATAKFAYHKLIMDKYNPREEPYTNLKGEVYLLGLWQYENGHLFFQYLNRTLMENGQINIIATKSEIERFGIGGYLIYGYDVENKKFGVVLDLSQPIYEGLYIKATGNFFPLD
jgi:hypothetical protein